MRILIVGAGGLGGYYGARLVEAGRDVTFLLRSESAKRLAAHGLRMKSPAGDVTIAYPQIVETGSLHETFDLVILTCKARDLDDAMNSLARFGRGRVLGGACFISAVREADGTIRHMGQPDRLVFGDRDEPNSARIKQIEAAMCGAGFDAARLDNIMQAMWEKWSFIATSAGITCLMRASVGDIIAAGYSGLTMQLLSENTSIAAAEGYPVGAELLGRADRMFHEKGSTFKASMLRDMEAGNPIEAQQIVGDLLERGKTKGLKTPLLEVVHAHLRCYEEQRSRVSSDVSG
jgi:2-dehydropantoate 2-reductase